MILLLIRPTPFPDEHLGGYVMRLAAANHLPDYKDLAAAANFFTKGSNPFDGAGTLQYQYRDLTKLASICGVPQPELERLFAGVKLPHRRIDYARWREVLLPLPLFRTRRAALCPFCVKENGYVRAQWDCVLELDCAQHGTQLIDVCPDCDAPLIWRRNRIYQCNCGFDLRKAEAPLAAPDDLAALADFHHHLREQPTKALIAGALIAMQLGHLETELPLERLRNASLETIRSALLPMMTAVKSEFLTAKQGETVFSAARSAPGWPPRLRALAVLAPRFDDEAANTMLNEMAEHWLANISEASAIESIGDEPFQIRRDLLPSLFKTTKLRIQKFLDDVDLPRTKTVATVISAPSLRSLFAAWRDFEDQERQQRALRLLHLSTNTKRDRRSAPVEDRETFLGLVEVAKALGSYTEQVRSLIRLGYLTATSQRNRYWISSKQVDAFNRQYVLSAELSKVLKYPSRAISSRLRALGIEPVAGPGIDGALTYLYDRASTAQVTGCERLEIPEGRKTGEMRHEKEPTASHSSAFLSRDDVLAILGTTNGKLASLSRKRILVSVRLSAGKPAVWYDRVAVEDFIARFPANPKLVTLNMAANEIGISVNDLRKIVEGCLQREIVASGLDHYVERDVVDALVTQLAGLVSSSEAASRLNLDKYAIHNLHRTGMIQPKLVLGSGWHKRHFFCAKEIQNLHRENTRG